MGMLTSTVGPSLICENVLIIIATRAVNTILIYVRIYNKRF